MSSFAVYERYYAGDQSPERKRSTGKSRKRGKEVNLNRILTVLIVFLAFVLAGELVFHLFISPRLVLRKVTISSDGYCPLSNDEILHAAGLDGVVSYLGIREKTLEEQLAANPMIQSATVSKRFPDGLVINVVPRRPLASIIAEVDGRSRLLSVDSQGYVIPGKDEPDESMPVISGVRLVDVRPGMRFPEELVDYLQQLEALRKSSPELYNLISEIKFVKKSTTGYEVVLFPGYARLRVRTGPELNAEMLRSILLVIDVVRRQGMLDALAELDFRTGEVVYRTRGG